MGGDNKYIYIDCNQSLLDLYLINSRSSSPCSSSSSTGGLFPRLRTIHRTINELYRGGMGGNTGISRRLETRRGRLSLDAAPRYTGWNELCFIWNNGRKETWITIKPIQRYMFIVRDVVIYKWSICDVVSNDHSNKWIGSAPGVVIRRLTDNKALLID